MTMTSGVPLLAVAAELRLRDVVPTTAADRLECFVRLLADRELIDGGDRPGSRCDNEGDR